MPQKCSLDIKIYVVATLFIFILHISVGSEQKHSEYDGYLKLASLQNSIEIKGLLTLPLCHNLAEKLDLIEIVKPSLIIVFF